MELLKFVPSDSTRAASAQIVHKEMEDVAEIYSSSHDALLLTEALRVAQNTEDARRDKIDAIKRQIANGTYKIDSKRIASAIIKEELELFS